MKQSVKNKGFNTQGRQRIYCPFFFQMNNLEIFGAFILDIYPY